MVSEELQHLPQIAIGDASLGGCDYARWLSEEPDLRDLMVPLPGVITGLFDLKGPQNC
jgi:hypothetical protein